LLESDKQVVGPVSTHCEICDCFGNFKMAGFPQPVTGAPIMMSFPHFYLGDPSLLDTVAGLKPDPEKHDGYLDVHEASSSYSQVDPGPCSVQCLKVTGCYSVRDEEYRVQGEKWN
jgi:hypothetical protein